MSTDHERLYTATELASELGVTARALRFYETKGLLRPRRAGRRRVYDHRDRARLALVLRGKRLGFTLAEIREYLELYDVDPGQVEQLRRLSVLVERRIEDLRRQREALDATLGELDAIRAQVRDALAERSGPRPRIRPKAGPAAPDAGACGEDPDAAGGSATL